MSGNLTHTAIGDYVDLVSTAKELPREMTSQRFRIMTGTNTVPSTGERSVFNMERYKFLLYSPFKISEKCCNIMKKAPCHDYEKVTDKKPILATMASESRLRTQKWLQLGCNAYSGSHVISKPMSFWTEQDVLFYIKHNEINIASVYGDIVKDFDKTNQVDGQIDMSELDASLGIFDLGRPLLKTTGCARTGCMFCGYGCHLEKSPNRFEKMKGTHPKQYDYIMRSKELGGLNYKEVIDWINEHGDMDIKY